MSHPAPKKIQLSTPTEITFTWQDGTLCTLPLTRLRDECPCAGCKGENILGKVHMPLKLPQYSPGMYDLANIETVGNYAVQFFWKDGHSTGIYTWEYIEVICRAHTGAPKKGVAGPTT